MRREIVATRRTGVTTSVVKSIPIKGKHCACIRIKQITVDGFISKKQKKPKIRAPSFKTAKN
jgi:hypothetical protein